MRKIMVIQHISCETLGLFSEEAADMAQFTYIRPYTGEPVPDSLKGWDGLIILGGPMAVYETEINGYLQDEIDLIDTAINLDFPVLGICLGSQLIAAAAGTAVYPGTQREAGWGEVSLADEAEKDPLFGGLPSPLPVFQLHGDTYDLPAGAVRLAENSAYANQAFRLGSNIYGLQFHVEVTSSLVKEWSAFYREYISGAGVSPDGLLVDLEVRSELLRPVARQIATRFLQLG